MHACNDTDLGADTMDCVKSFCHPNIWTEAGQWFAHQGLVRGTGGALCSKQAFAKLQYRRLVLKNGALISLTGATLPHRWLWSSEVIC